MARRGCRPSRRLITANSTHSSGRSKNAPAAAMVLNTSFNVKGQPIVNTPQEAIETFLGTGIEFLFLENILVRKC